MGIKESLLSQSNSTVGEEVPLVEIEPVLGRFVNQKGARRHERQDVNSKNLSGHRRSTFDLAVIYALDLLVLGSFYGHDAERNRRIDPVL
jgi:hypothetical protein